MFKNVVCFNLLASFVVNLVFWTVERKIKFKGLILKHVYDFNNIFYMERNGWKPQNPVTEDWHHKGNAIKQSKPLDEINIIMFLKIERKVYQYNEVQL